MPLFEEPEASRLGPIGWTEPSVRWFDASTRPEAAESRRIVNEWYADFPGDAQGRFAKRLRSQDDVTHHQALDELFVHALLKTKNDDVRYEEGGVGPDFRVYRDDACIAAVEVLSLFQRQDWTAEEKRHWQLAHELNSRIRPTAGYFVNFDIELAETQPSPSKFAQFVRQQIEHLPPHTDLGLPVDASWLDLPMATYEEPGVRITVRFLPMRPQGKALSDPEARIVGSGPLIGGAVNTGSRLKDRLEAKAGGRYKIEGIPFLTVAVAHDLMCTDDQVLNAVYGGEAVVVATSEMVRRNDGLFGVDPSHPQGRQRRLSAVSVINGFRPWCPDETDVALLHNPYAAYPWPSEVLDATRVFGPVESTNDLVQFDWIISR